MELLIGFGLLLIGAVALIAVLLFVMWLFDEGIMEFLIFVAAIIAGIVVCVNLAQDVGAWAVEKIDSRPQQVEVK